jgi:hypothetical protein
LLAGEEVSVHHPFGEFQAAKASSDGVFHFIIASRPSCFSAFKTPIRWLSRRLAKECLTISINVWLSSFKGSGECETIAEHGLAGFSICARSSSSIAVRYVAYM